MTHSGGIAAPSWEAFETLVRTVKQDMISVPKTILAMVDGDYRSAVILWHIVWWHLPNEKGETKLRVSRGNRLWLAMPREDWHDFWIHPTKADRVLAGLEEDGLIDRQVGRFNGRNTPLIALNRSAFARQYLARDNLAKLIISVLPN